MSPRDHDDNAKKKQDRSELVATTSMCYHCFDCLIQELKGGSRQTSWRTAMATGKPFPPHSSNSSNTSNMSPSKTTAPHFADERIAEDVKCPIFVTWEKQTRPGQSHTYELRGCIGTLQPKHLVPSVGHYALLSALQDRRFQPIGIPEIPFLRVAVSLLVNYEPCDDCYDWTVGVHGIMIQWDGHYSATYLPEVAKEQGWDQATTIRSLIRKAGYQGAATTDLLKRIKCTRYQSSKVKVAYADYIQYVGYDPCQEESLPFQPGESHGHCVLM